MTQSELRAFLGITGHYYKCVQDYAITACHIHELAATLNQIEPYTKKETDNQNSGPMSVTYP